MRQDFVPPLVPQSFLRCLGVSKATKQSSIIHWAGNELKIQLLVFFTPRCGSGILFPFCILRAPIKEGPLAGGAMCNVTMAIAAFPEAASSLRHLVAARAV